MSLIQIPRKYWIGIPREDVGFPLTSIQRRLDSTTPSCSYFLLAMESLHSFAFKLLLINTNLCDFCKQS